MIKRICEVNNRPPFLFRLSQEMAMENQRYFTLKKGSKRFNLGNPAKHKKRKEEEISRNSFSVQFNKEGVQDVFLYKKDHFTL